MKRCPIEGMLLDSKSETHGLDGRSRRCLEDDLADSPKKWMQLCMTLDKEVRMSFEEGHYRIFTYHSNIRTQLEELRNWVSAAISCRSSSSVGVCSSSS
jgi:hypothetical protein